jgi:hypothetical protein
MEYEVVRDVTTKECHWLDENIKQGATVYKFYGHTYGCIASGIAVTLSPDGDNPFFEIPRNAITEKETIVND